MRRTNRGVFVKEGILGLYIGCTPTLMKTFAGQGVALVVYDRVKGGAF